MNSSPPIVLSVFGTRPEAIKMAPVVRALRARGGVVCAKLCVTAQHRHMLDQVLGLFDLRPDFDLDLMRPEQDLGDLTASALTGLRDVLRMLGPSFVVVQGDTSTTFAAALAAFYEHVPVAHVEAGLRTWNREAPWPEEMNRRLTSALADLHFAPTEGARLNLLSEGVRPDRVHVTGNTVVDALQLMTELIDRDVDRRNDLEREFAFLDPWRRLVLVTAHRRENFGASFENICVAMRDIVREHADVQLVYPVHLNPSVREPVRRLLGDVWDHKLRHVAARGDIESADSESWKSRIHLVEPIEYLPFVHLMRRAYLLITDSGGIQEEATALGKPVLVMRDVTERPEAVAVGAARLVGTSVERIVSEARELLEDRASYGEAVKAASVFGDGHAGDRITDVIIRHLAG